MNNINVTMELCTEDRARLDRLIAALEKVAPRQLYAIDLSEAPAEGAESEPEAPEAETPQETQPEPEKATEPKSEPDVAPTITVDDIRSKVLTLTGAGKKDEVRAIVKEYAEKVGDIPADKRAEVHKRLCALEG